MHSFSVLILALLVGSSIANYCQADLPVVETISDHKLEFVQTIIRHGDRTPIRTKPAFEGSIPVEWICNLNSLNKPSQGNGHSDSTKRLFRTIFKDGREVLPGNCNLGQLTDKGYSQHVSLGKTLKEVYKPFGLFDNGTSSITIRSTNVYRTLQSAMAEITGMFPEESINTPLTEVIEVETRDQEMENMTPDRGCPTYLPALNAFHKTSKWTNFQSSKKVQNLTSYLKKAFKQNAIPTFDELNDVYSSRKCHGFPIPPQITDEVYQNIVELATWEMNNTAIEPSLTKIGMGPFISTLRDNIVNFISDKSKRTIRYKLFSGHDSTVGPLLGALELFDGVWPPYASHIEIELWSKAGQFFTQLKYNGKTLTLPCGKLCKVESFVNWMSKYVPTQQECFGK